MYLLAAGSSAETAGAQMRVKIAAAVSALLPAVALLALGGFVTHNYWSPDGVVLPLPAIDIAARSDTTATVVLAGGCFWGVQAVFQHTKGVTSAVSGYAGGEASTANYGAVGGGDTGHAEAVRVTYDPRVISYG